jgi:hypothetical protein
MRTKIYKDKGDISYLTFKNFSEVIELNDADSFVTAQTVEYFNPDSVANFALALQTEPKTISIPYKIDFEFKTAGKFIDCDTFLKDEMIVEFLELVVKRKYFWQKVKLEKLSIAQVYYIVGLFNEKASEIKEAHEWIYNPPMFGGNSEITQGTEERQDFATHYGGYIEMTYLIAGGDVSKFDDITNWSLDKYLFLGEYCLRKRTVENLK